MIVARVKVLLPSLLASIAAAPRAIELEAATVRGALDSLFQTHPGLRIHLFAEDGKLRQHVLCYWNEKELRTLAESDPAVTEGDTLRILQAVSGG
jgi:sulfur-carrier protein